MGNRRSSIDALIRRCKQDIQELEKAYRDSLHEKEVSDDLRIDIKNFCGNLRSVLDYLSHDIRETHCSSANPRDRFYFPIRDSRPDFEGCTRKDYPDLDKNAPRPLELP